jgi:hypothetical protein
LVLAFAAAAEAQPSEADGKLQHLRLLKRSWLNDDFDDAISLKLAFEDGEVNDGEAPIQAVAFDDQALERRSFLKGVHSIL